jgi:3',5'-cyclic AMP phosphodiesterase CpdA
VVQVDAFGSEYPEIRARQEADLKAVYSRLDPAIPMVCVCGNHDVGNSPTPATIQKYKDSFGDDYFSFYKNGVAFLVLNSQFYEDSSHVAAEYRAHEDWMEEQLRLAGERGVAHIVVFQHIPWFLREWDEEKVYFNVEKELRLKKLEELHKAGVRKVFCGHYHRWEWNRIKEKIPIISRNKKLSIPSRN